MHPSPRIPLIKTRSLPILLILFIIILSTPSSAEEFTYVIYEPSTQGGDCTAHAMKAQSYPGKWTAYQDQIFNITVRRFTDHLNDYGVHHDHEPNIQYSTFTCGNSDSTKVLFKLGDRNAAFYDAGRGSFLRYKNFGSPGGGDMELRWSHSDPNLLFYRQETRFYRYNYATDTSELVKDFADWYPTAKSVSNNDKGEQSWGDDRYWAFRVRFPEDAAIGSNAASRVVCYDYAAGTKWDVDLHGYYESRGWGDVYPSPRYVTMSPSGKYVIVNFVTGGSKGGGHTALFRRGSMNKLEWVRDLLDWQTGHPAWGYDLDGNEVFYRFDSPNLYMYDLETGTRYTILDAKDDCPECAASDYFARDKLGNSRAPGFHISTGYNLPGWVFYSSYDGYAGKDCTHWLDRVIFAIKASRDKANVVVWRIAHTRTSTDAYDNQARTQISQDGKYIYYDSNWLGGHDREIFRAELPNDWYGILNATNNKRPTASVSVDSPTGLPPLAVRFSSSGSDPDGTIVSYRWDFGDGSSSNEQNPTHVYNNPGNYTAQLTVTDNGEARGTASVSISVSEDSASPPASPNGLKIVSSSR